MLLKSQVVVYIAFTSLPLKDLADDQYNVSTIDL